MRLRLPSHLFSFFLAFLPTVLPAVEIIAVDPKGIVRPFPHVWEQTFGSERAIVSLRESYRRDLEAVRAATGIQSVRFHGIFHDEVGVYRENLVGEPYYVFTYVDQIYDGLLARGVKPFIELSFMPSTLAPVPKLHSFSYHPNIAPPKSPERWAGLVSAFALHLVERYGIEEVSSWNFEVWNEPNLDFWGGDPKQQTYFELYDLTARALKKVSPRLRVGGPATAFGGWIPPFLEFCKKRQSPIDFVSTHAYGDDRTQDALESAAPVGREDLVPLVAAKVKNEVLKSAFPQLPVYFTEVNATYKRYVDITDSPYMGPWLAHTISQCDGNLDLLSFWTFSDVFEEMGPPPAVFYGGFGLLATGDIPKPSFHAFALLHRLGDQRILNLSKNALITKRSDDRLVIAVWNLADPGSTGIDKDYEIRMMTGSRYALVDRVDAQNGCALNEWELMGKPSFPTQDQQKRLRQAAILPPTKRVLLPQENEWRVLKIRIPAHGLVLVTVPLK